MVPSVQVDGDQSAAPAPGVDGDAAVTTSTPPTTTEDPNVGAAGDTGSLKVIHHANTTYLFSPLLLQSFIPAHSVNLLKGMHTILWDFLFTGAHLSLDFITLMKRHFR